MRKPFIAGNWKMYKTIREAKAFADEFKGLITDLPDVDVAFCVPYLQLAAMKEAFIGTTVKVGAQNMHFEDNGAYTGEISAPMLKELGIDCCIIGHSERRQYFNETDAACCLKVKKTLESGMTPILCVGEDLEQRENGRAFDIVKSQLEGCLAGLDVGMIEKVVIAYEPVWAIGTGKNATSGQASEMAAFIRKSVRSMFGGLADKVIIQYGGSVKPGNIAELMSMADIDGALVGGASLEASDFSKIINYQIEETKVYE